MSKQSPDTLGQNQPMLFFNATNIVLHSVREVWTCA